MNLLISSFFKLRTSTENVLVRDMILIGSARPTY